jgi:hypothetical protein
MREPMTGGKPPKKTTTASPRNTGDMPAKKKVTVSQATIDKIKSQGMAAAIKKVAAGGAGAAYTEGVKRMYGAARVAKATSANINAASKPKAYGAKNMPAYRPATSAGTTKAAPKAGSSKSPSNATKLFGLLGGTNMSNPKGPKTAAYAAAEAKRVAAARAAEAKRRAAKK